MPSNMKRYAAQARIFKALMHPARLAILDVLRAGAACVCHLEAALGYRQAYISQHLMVLREAGLVEDRREGWNIYYRVAVPAVLAVMDAARKDAAQKDAAQKDAAQSETPGPHAAKLAHCPCPHCQSETIVAKVK